MLNPISLPTAQNHRSAPLSHTQNLGSDIATAIEALKTLNKNELTLAFSDAMKKTIDDLSKNPKGFDPHTLGVTFVRNAAQELAQALQNKPDFTAYSSKLAAGSKSLSANSAEALIGAYAAIVKAGYDISCGKEPGQAFAQSTFQVMDEISQHLGTKDQFNNFLESQDGKPLRDALAREAKLSRDRNRRHV